MAIYVEKVISYALSEVGYQSNGHYNKYAKDLDRIKYFNYPKNGVADHCSIGVNWFVWKASGSSSANEARKAMFEPSVDNCAAGCTQAAGYFKAAKAWISSPKSFKAGDQVFFKKTNGVLYHTGLVVAVSNNGITTVECNTSGGKTLKKSYSFSDPKLGGAGRPKYSTSPAPAPDPKPDPEPETKTTEYKVATNGSTLTLRASATTKAPALATIKNGTLLKVSEIVKGEKVNGVDDWAKTTYNGKTGFVSCRWAKPVNPPKPATATYIVATNGSTLTLRASATTKAPALATIKNGTKIIVSEIVKGEKVNGVDDWAKTTINGKTGFVSCRWIRKI